MAATSCRTVYGFFEVMPEAIFFLVPLRAMNLHNWIKIFLLLTCSAPHGSSGLNLVTLSGSELDLQTVRVPVGKIDGTILDTW